jgi:beta-galactosidase
MSLRTDDPEFMRHVEQWFDVLLPIIRPLLYANGGPVIWLQVENEYGSYHTCDKGYLRHLLQLVRRHLGPSPILTTVDGYTSTDLGCVAHVDGFLRTVDFGPNDGGTDPLSNFDNLRVVQPRGPLVNSEFYSGWQSYWGEHFETLSTDAFTRAYSRLLAGNGGNVSVNMYMFHGGTNFGFSSSAYPGESSALPSGDVPHSLLHS